MFWTRVTRLYTNLAGQFHEDGPANDSQERQTANQDCCYDVPGKGCAERIRLCGNSYPALGFTLLMVVGGTVGVLLPPTEGSLDCLRFASSTKPQFLGLTDIVLTAIRDILVAKRRCPGVHELLSHE